MTLLSVFLLGLLGGLHCAGMCGGIVAALTMRGGRTRADSSAPRGASRQAAGGPPAALVRESPVQWHGTNPRSTSRSVETAGATAAALEADPAWSLAHGVPSARSSSRFLTLFARGGPLSADALMRAFAINGGRLTTYVLLGTAAGAAGSALWLLETALPVQRFLFIATNAVMIAIGAWLLGVRALFDWTERVGQHVWRTLQPLASRLLGAQSSRQLFMAGAVWGFVPCGMVYMVLLSALGAGSAVQGGLLMAVFGLGTLPNLMAMALGGQWLNGFVRRPVVRRAVAVFVIGMGALGVARGLLFEPVTIFGLCITPVSGG